MERTALHLEPSQRKKLAEIAKRDHVSIAEVGRRAIEQYIEISNEEMKLLDTMADALIESNKRAENAADQAIAYVEELLKKRQEKEMKEKLHERV